MARMTEVVPGVSVMETVPGSSLFREFVRKNAPLCYNNDS